jgi:hypothetical protein
VSAAKITPPTPAILLEPVPAAAALGMSVDTFDRYVKPEVRCVRCGRKRLYLVRELERWADENAEAVFDAS